MSARFSLVLGLLALIGCSEAVAPRQNEGKGDSNRALLTRGAPYPLSSDWPTDASAFDGDMERQREFGWNILERATELVDINALNNNEALANFVDGTEASGKIPRFLTWYSADEIGAVFRIVYGEKTQEARRLRESIGEDEIESAIDSWIEAAGRRFADDPARLFESLSDAVCQEEESQAACRRRIEGHAQGDALGTLSEVYYSPAAMNHLLSNYDRIEQCLEDRKTLGFDAEPDAENFSICFREEFPEDAAIVKAKWLRAELGFTVPDYKTDAETLGQVLQGDAEWDRECLSDDDCIAPFEECTPGATPNNMGICASRHRDPQNGKIFTVTLPGGHIFRLAGLHIMTKELRHWTWTSIWWSSQPKDDFGADRSDSLATSIWRNYKMCNVLAFEANPVGDQLNEHPDLKAALEATEDETGASWCSNAYIERGHGNARTNCIGCHQHGGANVVGWNPESLRRLEQEDIIQDESDLFPDTGRTQVREVFPADYLFSLDHSGSVAIREFQATLNVFDALENPQPEDREAQIAASVSASLQDTEIIDQGQRVYEERCASCHGDRRQGGFAPSLSARKMQRLELDYVVSKIISGSANMPEWGEILSDEEIAAVITYLKADS